MKRWPLAVTATHWSSPNSTGLRGKQPKLNHRQEAHLTELFNDGEYSPSELADLFGVARSTVYRAVERERARNSSGGGTAS
ncbi:MAG: helix-turn-helix domain-containing protein [Aeromicrobium sp.]